MHSQWKEYTTWWYSAIGDLHKLTWVNCVGNPNRVGIDPVSWLPSTIYIRKNTESVRGWNHQMKVPTQYKTPPTNNTYPKTASSVALTIPTGLESALWAGYHLQTDWHWNRQCPWEVGSSTTKWTILPVTHTQNKPSQLRQKPELGWNSSRELVVIYRTIKQRKPTVRYCILDRNRTDITPTQYTYLSTWQSFAIAIPTRSEWVLWAGYRLQWKQWQKRAWASAFLSENSKTRLHHIILAEVDESHFW